MEKSEKIKRIVLIFIGALASGYFMYSGFSLLMHDEVKEINTSNGVRQLSE